MPINIFCLKWGTKYDKDWVIRLYNLCRKTIKHEFTFYCYTDQPFEYEGIKILEIPDSDKYLSVWWHKIGLFNMPEFQDQNNIFFDLDMFIREDITNEIKEWFSTISEENYLSMSWCPALDFYKWHNSSIFVWRNSKLLKEKIYDYIMKDEFSVMFKYTGFDMFLKDSIEKERIKIHKLKDVFKRCRVNYNNDIEIKIKANEEHYIFIDPKYKIYNFNGLSDNQRKYRHLTENPLSTKPINVEQRKHIFETIIKNTDFNLINKDIEIQYDDIDKFISSQNSIVL